jgi:hypothetical protein
MCWHLYRVPDRHLREFISLIIDNANCEVMIGDTVSRQLAGDRQSMRDCLIEANKILAILVVKGGTVTLDVEEISHGSKLRRYAGQIERPRDQ